MCLAQPSAAAGRADLVPVSAGNAFADGIGTVYDKLTFPPGDMSSPMVVRPEANPGLNNDVFGYDFTPDGQTLYGIHNGSSSLITVDQQTGVPSTVAPVTKPPPGPLPVADVWGDLIIDPVRGNAFVVFLSTDGSTALLNLNLTTGATTPIATLPGVLLIDLAMNCAGELYAEAIGGNVYRVNPTTGALTLIGPTGRNLTYAQGMDFDNATGILHAWTFDDSSVAVYASINLSTGAATAFPGGSPNGEFEGAMKTLCAPGATVTNGPSGHTADLRPSFGFKTTSATSVQCSVASGTAVFVACPGATYQPAADLAPGDYTFRVKVLGVAAQTANATRAFTVVDCATLRANVAKAKKQLKTARKKLRKAKKSGVATKVKKAKKKLKKAKKKLKKAKAALAAEPVCA
jgi:hypothetical protein